MIKLVLFLLRKFQILVFSIVLIAPFLYSCNSDGSGYKSSDSGLKFKYIKENPNGKHPKVADFIELRLIYTNNKDSVLFDSKEINDKIKMQVYKPKHIASFENALLMLKTGEQALFKISADSFFIKTKKEKVPNWINKGEELTFNIELLNILDNEEVKNEQKLLKEKRRKEEDEILNRFISENNIKETESMSGLYYIEKNAGKGKRAEPGDILLVHYTGKFIDGEVFDSSLDRNKMFAFKLGNSEVIAGWEEGFSKMNEGGKAKLIIPSQLAYGEEGYGKIIPSYTTLVFDIELIKIKEKNN